MVILKFLRILAEQLIIAVPWLNIWLIVNPSYPSIDLIRRSLIITTEPLRKLKFS